MPEDRYRFLKACYAIVDQATGKPAGTTPVGSLEEADIATIMGKLARAATVINWGIVAGAGLMAEQCEKADPYALHVAMEFPEFNWTHFYGIQRSLRVMVGATCEPSILIRPEIMHEVFRSSGKRARVTDAYKRFIWQIVRTNRLSEQKARDLMAALTKMMLTDSDYDDDELLRIAQQTAQVVKDVDNTLTNQDVAEGDRGGEGERPEEGDPAE